MTAIVDPRLLDAVAMCLCWAEYGQTGIANRPVDETPASYWGGMQQVARQTYCRDARVLALAMMTDRDFAVVPAELSAAQIEAAVEIPEKMIPRLRRTYEAMIAAARIEMRWRQPSCASADEARNSIYIYKR